MRRFFDSFFALIFIFLLLPILIVIILMIRVTSKGPALFTQIRIGLNGEKYNMYKFRTMYVGAPMDTPTHLLDTPGRYITPVGRFLRRASLDELPQLLNIVKGEMSFIGPRPALYNQQDLIELREKYGVHKVRPGITGWAQVNGRDELPIPIKVEYDRYYVENQSFTLDLKIILMTVYNVLLAKGVIEGKQGK